MGRDRALRIRAEGSASTVIVRRPMVALQPGFLRVLLTEIRCGIETMGLLVTRRLAMPSNLVGHTVTFRDGSISRVYRETFLRGAREADPVLIVVQFRLRLLGSSRLGHALFRFESLFNTFLFAAHPGFRTKLWLTDLVTGFYRGIYEWDDAESASRYAEVLRVVLAPWVQSGTFDYRVVIGVDRDRFLAGEAAVADPQVADFWALPATGDSDG